MYKKVSLVSRELTGLSCTYLWMLIHHRSKNFDCFCHVAFYLQHGEGSGAIVSSREMKFGTLYESPSSRLGVDEPVLVPKEISSGSKMAREKHPRHGLGLPALGPSGTGLRVTCRTDWSFLAPYQRRKAESGSGRECSSCRRCRW